jgi:signal transduction histidine kinase
MISGEEADARMPDVGMPDAGELERIDRARLVSAAFVAVAVVSLAVVIASFWRDVVPDEHHLGSESFIWWRLVFVILTIGTLAFAWERDHSHRRMLRQMVDEHQRLTDADRVRADVVASITHELKTPLTSLLGYASILRKRADSLSPQQRDEYIGVLEQQGQRILHLIEDLLQSARMEAAPGRLQRSPLDLASLARAVGNEMSIARARPVEIDVHDEDLGLFGDRSAMEHVLTNLVDNAMKYSDDGSVIRIGMAESDAEVVLSVSDSGVGIASEDLPHIFERFRQASNARGHSSVGLGLYIVSNLVAAHGGRVWAESEHGKGTTVFVALPRRAR